MSIPVNLFISIKYRSNAQNSTAFNDIGNCDFFAKSINFIKNSGASL